MNHSEEDIKKVNGIDNSGTKTPLDPVKEIILKSLPGYGKSEPVSKKASTNRAILTAFGYNHPGVVSSITKFLGDSNCDIQDISQKIMQEFFTMIMLIDITNSSKDLKDIQDEMNKISSDLGIKIYIQHEDVFRYMHRI